ncbi:DEK C terminal domain protein [Cryptosporidium meleagridis]|uniref:DEK C terminal domain protein n=1 Tax=Cryptosporidium meleagridis TaxID=93969 RepID=A0A2P4YWH2_9CRYT|nr:DEK C terminal domain protein [Cryptosporidium meleagridis]
MEDNPEDSSQLVNISPEVIRTYLNKIVTNDNLDTLTPKKVREELEKSLGLPLYSLKPKKNQINDLIDTIILEIKEKNPTNSPVKQAMNSASSANDKDEGTNGNNEEEHNGLNINIPEITKQNGKAIKRKQISMSIEEFLEKSQTLSLSINGSSTKLAISPRQFSTGSVGWYYGGKIPLPVGDDLEVLCQISINCTVVGSKTWPQNTSKKSKSK